MSELEALFIKELDTIFVHNKQMRDQVAGRLAALFQEAGAQWSCSSRCWQEGGPHDETCHATQFWSIKP